MSTVGDVARVGGEAGRVGVPAAGSARLRVDIQALRAVAVALVVLYHAETVGLPGGYVGVDVFYVISGFVISGLVLRELDRTGTIRLRNFYARRARRILPAATFVVVVTFLLSAAVLAPLRMPAVSADGVAAALFYSNFRFAQQATDYLQLGGEPSPYLHYWSLAVEEQFYLFWPSFFVLVAVRRRGRRRPGTLINPRLRLAVAVSAAFAASLWLSVYLTPRSPTWAFFISPTRVFEFAAGALVALAGPALARLDRRLATLLVLTGLATIAASGVVLNDRTPFPGTAALLPVLGAAAFIVGGERATALHRLWSLQPLQLLGRMSYSLYLWHWPAMILPVAGLERPLTAWERAAWVAVAVLASAVTLRYVEDPLRRAPAMQRPARALGVGTAMSATAAAMCLALAAPVAAARTPDPIAPSGAAPVIGPTATATATAGPTASASASAWPEPTGPLPLPADLHPTLKGAVLDRPVSDDDGCNPKFGTKSGACIYGDTTSGTTIALFGDSHAAQWLPAVDAIGKRRHWKVLAMVKSACPPLMATVRVPETGRPHPECDIWRRTALQRIIDARPAIVVLTQLRNYDISNADWGPALAQTIQILRVHSRVVVLGDTPRPPRNIPQCLSKHPSDSRICDLPSTSVTGQDRRPVERAIADSLGVGFVDPTPWLCSPTRCPVVSGSYLVYRDASHITATYAIYLQGRLEQAVVSGQA